jgi:hypothetical protein
MLERGFGVADLAASSVPPAAIPMLGVPLISSSPSAIGRSNAASNRLAKPSAARARPPRRRIAKVFSA